MDSTNHPIPSTKRPKWLLPVGIVLVGLAALFALILCVFSWMMKSSDVYQKAIAIAKSAPSAMEQLGTPIEDGLLTSGHMKISGPSGNAALAIPVSGPKGSGTIFLEAHKSLGEWSFSRLVLEVDASKQRTNLLDPQDRR